MTLLLFVLLIFMLPQATWAMGTVQALIAEPFYVLATLVPSALVWLSGVMLNMSIKFMVVDMGAMVSDSGNLGFAVNNLWLVVRDTMNLLFIFGLVYVGINTILHSNDSSTRKSLVNIIGAALLINFSLLIVKVIIDFSNTIAVQIYNRFLLMDSALTTGGQLNIGDYLYSGVSGAFADAMGISSLTGSFELIKSQSFSSALILSFLAMIFLTVLAIVFAAGSFMLVARMISLIIYMIFSPVMFLGWILPNFAGYSKGWMNGFLKKAFFAPAYLFMLYLSYISVLYFSAGGRPVDGYVWNMFGGETVTVLFFVFATGMLIASIIVAQKASIAGAGTTMGLLKSTQKTLQGQLYRRTAGRGLNYLLKKRDALDQRFAADEAKDKSRSWVNRKLGRGLVRGAAKTITVGGEETRKALVSARDYGAGGVGYSAAEKMQQERTARVASTSQKDSLKSAINSYLEDKNDSAKIASLERALQETHPSVIADMAKGSDLELIKNVSGELTDAQWKAIQDEKEIDVETKKSLNEPRAAQIIERLGRIHASDTKATLDKTIHKADASELKAIGLTGVLPYAEYLTSKQIDDWKDLTTTEKGELKAQRKAGLIKTFKSEDGAKKIFERFTSDTERSKLPDSILNDKKSINYLNKNVLTKIVDNDGITDETRSQIKSKILEYYGVDEVTKDRTKFEGFMEWFDKNNAGQRY